MADVETGFPKQPIDEVAQRTTSNKPRRSRRDRTAQPMGKAHHSQDVNQLQRGKNPGGVRAKGKGCTGVKNEPQLEEIANHLHRRTAIESLQSDNLGQLINNRN